MNTYMYIITYLYPSVCRKLVSVRSDARNEREGFTFTYKSKENKEKDKDEKG